MDGFKEILSIKASMNLGLPMRLKTIFPNISYKTRSEVKDNNIKDSHWVTGFTSGELQGCFLVYVLSSCNTRLGETVRLKFQITQHKRDRILIENLVAFFQCGRIEWISSHLCLNYVVTNFKDIIEKIIPFFDKYSIQGKKYLDYHNFKIVANLMKNKAHLTKEGLCEIRSIKLKMNSYSD